MDIVLLQVLLDDDNICFIWTLMKIVNVLNFISVIFTIIMIIIYWYKLFM